MAESHPTQIAGSFRTRQKPTRKQQHKARDGKIKFQHKICFIKFLFFYFISTLHQAFTLFASLQSPTDRPQELQRRKKKFSPCSRRCENTLKSPQTSHNSQQVEGMGLLWGLFRGNVKSIAIFVFFKSICRKLIFRNFQNFFIE